MRKGVSHYPDKQIERRRKVNETAKCYPKRAK